MLGPGAIVGRYVIESVVRRDPLSLRYRVRDLGAGTPFLLQLYLIADPARVAQMLDKARNLRSLRHANIVGIVDAIHVHHRWPALVLEDVDGDTLAERLTRQRPDAEEGMRWFAGIARGLQAAHTAGVAHGDLAPAMVVLDAGQPRIQGFGASTWLTTDPAMAAFALQDAAYASPNRLRGGPATIEADQFSLGCILYELVSGRRAFSSKVTRSRTHFEPLSTDVPGHIRALVDALLSDHPPSCDDVLERLAPETEARTRNDQLLGAVAHEIKNPLTFITANLDYVQQILKAGPVNERARRDVVEALDDMREGVDRIRSVVGQVGELGRATDDIEVVNIAHVLHRSCEMAAPRMKGAMLSVDIRTEAQVRVDPQRLGQIVLNLLANAGDAVAEQLRGRVWLSATEAGGDVVIEVTDNGPGVAPQLAERIFEPWFSTKGAGKGAGLGLHLCRELVSRMDGSLELTPPALGGGARFRLTLPKHGPRKYAPTLVPGETELPSRMLVVDDEPQIVSAMRRALGDILVETATSVDDALRLLEVNPGRFDLILTDVHMPDRDGTMLLEEVETRYPELASRVLFMSGATRPTVPEERLLHKPVSPGQVRRVLQDMAG